MQEMCCQKLISEGRVKLIYVIIYYSSNTKSCIQYIISQINKIQQLNNFTFAVQK